MYITNRMFNLLGPRLFKVVCVLHYCILPLISQSEIPDTQSFTNGTNGYIITTEVSGNQTTRTTERKTDSIFRKEKYEITTMVSDIQSSTPFSFGFSVVDERCSIHGSCEPPEDVHFWYCRCDIDCEKYNDCCLNYDRMGSFDISSRFECIAKTNDEDNYDGFFAVATCPPLYINDTVIERCIQNDVLQHGPSVVSNDIIFKNKYCALCNNHSDFLALDLQFFNLDLSDEEFENFTKLSRREKLDVASNRGHYQQIIPAGIPTRRCVAKVKVQPGNINCTSFVNPVFSFRSRSLKIYRNYNCVPMDERNFVRCLQNVFKSIIQTVAIRSLSVIFTFRDVKPEESVKPECKEWTQEMAATGKCSDLETYQNKKMAMEYYLISNGSPTENEFIMSGLLSAWTYEVTNFTKFHGFNIRVDANENLDVYRIIISFRVVKKMFLSEINEVEKSLGKRTVRLKIYKNATAGTLSLYTSNVLPTNLTENSFKYIKIFRILTSVKDQLLANDINVSSVIIDKLCDIATIEITQGTDNSIQFESFGCQHLPEPIQIVDSLNNPALAIMTYVCLSLSVLSLMLLLVYIRKHGLHLKIPGNNLENLSISLFLSNILFMVGINESYFQIRKLCYVIGVLLHYLWLLTFSFMTVSVVYIACTLVEMKAPIARRQDDIQRRKRVLTIVGLLLPLFLVLPAIVVDQNGFLSLGYSSSICFPNQYPANILFFSGPVIVLMFTNFVCLTYTILKILRIRIDVKDVRKSLSFQDAKVYLRIVVLSGIFWVTGIFAVVFEAEWLNYVFTILCGLQGFSVALAIMSTFRFERRNTSSREYASKRTSSVARVMS